jgi:hypothetical protein
MEHQEGKWGRKGKEMDRYGLRPADIVDSTLVLHQLDRRHLKIDIYIYLIITRNEQIHR